VQADCRAYFYPVPVPEKLLHDILSRLNIDALSPMQQQVLTAAERKGDLVLIAPTGSGKTLAFLIPLLSDLSDAPTSAQALIIVPTRELAHQIENVWKKMGTGFSATLCYGGHDRQTEERSLAAAPALIIGTPGRLTDHFRRGNIEGKNIKSLVLDEFDKSLELGFQEEMAEIIGALKSLQRRMLCSATEAVEIPAFTGMRHPQRLHFPREAGPETLALQCLKLADKDKADALFRLLCQLGEESSVVFLNHRQAVERTEDLMEQKGIAAVAYHGAMEQEARELALARLRNGSARTLIATELAARGLDIPQLAAVIHYHLPADEAAFTHRNGRTARMGASGKAILMLGPDERLPVFLQQSDCDMLSLPEETTPPPPPHWRTLRIAAGKKDKLSKADVLGFLTQAAELKKEAVGAIEVKDNYTLVAVAEQQLSQALRAGKTAKLKGQKRLMAPAR
jgi:ATP-independent RNA helicase DbpA